MSSRYVILAEFKGSAQILAQFRQVQTEARRTTRLMIDGARQEQSAIREAKRREAEATREALRAVNEAERSYRRMMRAKEQLRREDLAAHRRYIAALEKEKSQFEEKKQKSLRMMGAGAVGLGLTAGGIKIAADFESAMANLRAAIQETGKDGKININQLAMQMVKLEDLAVSLGNRLPGSTADFVEMLTVLRQSGVEVTDILGGAGKAVAELAVATDAMPKELAKDFGQYVLQFGVAANDLDKLADLFAKIKTGSGLESGALIEGSKYFQLRAGAPLGMKGIEGARQGALLMASVKELGLEGTVGGTGLANFFSEAANKQKLAKLKKNFGIDLKLFDQKGNFLGVENVFKEMEKFRALSERDRMNALKQFAGDQGMGAGHAVVEKGADGWAKIVAKIERASSLQDTVNVKVQTFNNLLEAVRGTGENALARLFTPAMMALKPTLEGANALLAALEGMGKTNPMIAKALTTLMGVGSLALIAQGAVMRLTSSYRIWQLTARLAALDNQRLAASTAGVAAQTDAAASRAGKFGRVLKTEIPAAIGTTIVLTIATEVIAYILQLKKEAEDAWAEAQGSARGTAVSTAKSYAAEVNPEILLRRQRAGAKSSLASFLDAFEPAAVSGMDPLEWATFGMNPFRRWFGIGQSGMNKHMPEVMKKQMPELNIPSEFAFFLRAIKESKTLTQPEREQVTEAAGKAFPESLKRYRQALEWAAGNREAAERRLVELDQLEARALAQSGQTLTDRFIPAVDSATTELNKIKAPGGQPVEVESKASGGKILRRGIFYGHEGEMIMPGHATRKFEAGGFGGINLSYAPSINLSGGADPLAMRQLQGVLAAHKDELLAMLNREFRDRRMSV